MARSHLPAILLTVLVASCAKGSPPAAPTQTLPSPSASSAATPPAPRPDPLGTVYSKALEGDEREALNQLRTIPVDALDAKQREKRSCLLSRFETTAAPSAATTTLLDSALALYRDYWKRVLLQELDVPAGEALLTSGLRKLLGHTGRERDAADAGASTALSDLADELGARLSGEGLHSLRGITSPYRELMVWRTETRKTYPVVLPDGPSTVNVVLMRDFESLGWSAYATCDRAHTGGWAEKDRLYCVADSYDLGSEDFQVSYLTHEAQHFSDYKRFPKLEQPELEYRAKLAEIEQSRTTTRSLLETFAAQSGGDRSSPHSFADGLVVRDLGRALGVDERHPRTWTSVTDDAIRKAASATYAANTALLTSRGAATVEKVLAP